MIPKKIHFCWLSDNPYPKDLAAYMATWQKLLPDYEIVKWDFTRFPKEKSAWVRDAFESRKYAFAADYIRNYALYTEGGIYLDADIEVLKSFDSLLHLPYFFGYENGSGCIDAGIIASEKGNEMFKILLDYYDRTPFYNADGTPNILPLPKLMRKLHHDKYEYREIDSPEHFDTTPGIVSILPYDYFSPIHQETRQLQQTPRTMAIHRFAASWQTGWPVYSRKIKKMVGPKIFNVLIRLKRMIIGAPKYPVDQI